MVQLRIIKLFLIYFINKNLSLSLFNKMQRAGASAVISCIDPLGFPFKTLDPFLFCVYHKDLYPSGNSKMEAPRRGNGADFDPNAPYRMYHGDRIPGFPQHPHRGFETVTATMDGIIDHSDSCGNAGRYGEGDLQWMTAGKGVVHGEMFPLVNDSKPNTLRLFQIWLNLPARSKMVDPAFAMHWAEEIPQYVNGENNVKVTIWAGTLFGISALPPPPNSWASNPSSDLGIYFLRLNPGGYLTLPPANGGLTTNRVAYFIEGDRLSVGDSELADHCAVTLKADQSVEFRNTHTTTISEVLVLQGKPIGEPVSQRGPFVMNTDREIQTAFSDYQRTRFGGWPWENDAMVFPRDKGRFSLINKVESYPPTKKEII